MNSSPLEPRLFDPLGINAGYSNFGRVLIKLSGEALSGVDNKVIDGEIVERYATEIALAKRDSEIDIAVVVGAGNIWRGAEHPEMDRAQADYAGMLATIINALAIQDQLEQLNQPTRVMSAIETNKVVEPYIRRRALRHLEKGRVVIFAGGTGNPHFSTDTAAALRAAEIQAEAILMAKTGVDGIYSNDPNLNDNAERYDELSYDELISKGLKVMDATAVTLAKEKNIPIVVFDGQSHGSIGRILANPRKGTIVRN